MLFGFRCLNPFFGKQRLRLLLSRELELAGPNWGSFKLYPPPRFLFCWFGKQKRRRLVVLQEEQKQQKTSWFWKQKRRWLVVLQEEQKQQKTSWWVFERDSGKWQGWHWLGRVSSTARHVCAGLASLCLGSLRLASHRVLILGVFTIPLCRNSFCLRRNCGNGWKSCFSRFWRKQEKLRCSRRTQRLVRATEGRPGAWKAFRVFLSENLKFSFFEKESYIIIII